MQAKKALGAGSDVSQPTRKDVGNVSFLVFEFEFEPVYLALVYPSLYTLRGTPPPCSSRTTSLLHSSRGYSAHLAS